MGARARQACNDSNTLLLRVAPHASGQALPVALPEKLGNGTCGGAILNLMLSFAEGAGLPMKGVS